MFYIICSIMSITLIALLSYYIGFSAAEKTYKIELDNILSMILPLKDKLELLNEKLNYSSKTDEEIK